MSSLTKPIVVAVLDSGVYEQHQDLKTKVLPQCSRNFVLGNIQMIPFYLDKSSEALNFTRVTTFSKRYLLPGGFSTVDGIKVKNDCRSTLNKHQ